MEFSTDITGAVISGVIVGVATVLPFAVSYLRSRRRYGLRWAVLPPQSMMEIAEDIASSVSILYKEQKFDNLLRFQFILHNTGSTPLKMENTINPLIWKAPGEIVKAQILYDDPPVKIDIGTAGDLLVIEWKLFNQGCKAVIEIICEGKITGGNGRITDVWKNADNITGQIECIPKIEIKKIRWKNPDEIIRRMEIALSTEKPILRKLVKIFYNRFFILYSETIVGIYVFCTITPASVLIFLSKTGSLVATSIVVLIEIIVGLLLWYKFRNPYSIFLWKAHRKRRTMRTF